MVEYVSTSPKTPIAMLDNKFLQDLSDRLSRLVPAAEELRSEARTKIEQTLKSALADMDILTSEEFASQIQALQRAENRIAELEGQLQQMEARLAALESAD